MLTDEELAEIGNVADRLNGNSATRLPVIGNHLARLLAEVRELRLLLRDAVQDATPGNRLWREGVKAGLEAAAKVAQEAKESEMVQTAERATAWYACDMIRGLIRAIDPASILP